MNLLELVFVVAALFLIGLWCDNQALGRYLKKNKIRSFKDDVLWGYTLCYGSRLEGLKPTSVSVTKRYGVRVYSDTGTILSSMTLRRASYYANWWKDPKERK